MNNLSNKQVQAPFAAGRVTVAAFRGNFLRRGKRQLSLDQLRKVLAGLYIRTKSFRKVDSILTRFSRLGTPIKLRSVKVGAVTYKIPVLSTNRRITFGVLVRSALSILKSRKKNKLIDLRKAAPLLTEELYSSSVSRGAAFRKSISFKKLCLKNRINLKYLK